mgnify:FL=1
MAELTQTLRTREAKRRWVTLQDIWSYRDCRNSVIFDDRVCLYGKVLLRLSRLVAMAELIQTDKNNEGCTPLMYAAGNGDTEVIETLLRNERVGPDRQDNKGRKPLRLRWMIWPYQDCWNFVMWWPSWSRPAIQARLKVAELDYRVWRYGSCYSFVFWWSG